MISSPPAPDGTGVLLLSGGVYVLNTNKNRMYVRLSRALTARGARVLRLDYRGVGESTGMIGDYALDDPSPQDVRAGIDALLAAGARRIAVVGSCYGARAAMHEAAADPSLYATVLLAPPVGDTGRGAVAQPGDVGPVFLDRVTTLWHRAVPTLFVYGEQDPYYADFAACASGPLRPMLAEGSSLSVRVLPGQMHGLQRVPTQDAFVATALDFLTSIPAGAAR